MTSAGKFFFSTFKMNRYTKQFACEPWCPPWFYITLGHFGTLGHLGTLSHFGHFGHVGHLVCT